jgi:hypothetical protein
MKNYEVLKMVAEKLSKEMLTTIAIGGGLIGKENLQAWTDCSEQQAQEFEEFLIRSGAIAKNGKPTPAFIAILKKVNYKEILECVSN